MIISVSQSCCLLGMLDCALLFMRSNYVIPIKQIVNGACKPLPPTSFHILCVTKYNLLM